MDHACTANATGRYAPSPTGPLHLGNLRTALLAWLFARSRGASFYVRIEDLDRQRSRPEHVAGQLNDLADLGIDWDGEVVRQSGRAGRYRTAVQELRRRGLLYPCWCTRAEIRRAATAPHGEQAGDAYPGTCRHLSDFQRAARVRAGRPAAWRVAAGGRRAGFVDRLHGPVESAVDDFVVWREQPGDPDAGSAAYNLAVVIDDADQQVGEVVRGDDLLATTARQLLLSEMLGLTPPRFAHVPLVLGHDGTRLAKRHGAVTLAQQLAAGHSVPELVGWMAWTAGLSGRPEPCLAVDLVADFEPDRLSRRPTVWAGVPATVSRGPERP